MDLHVEAGTSIVGGHGFVKKERTRDAFRCSVALGPIPNNNQI